MIPMLAVSAGMTVLNSVSAQKAIDFEYDISKINAKINKANISTEASYQKEQVLINFNEFLDQHESLKGQQKSVLAAQQTNVKSSAYTEVMLEQEKEFYNNLNITEENLNDIKVQKNLSILANEAQKANDLMKHETDTRANFMNTLTSLGLTAFQASIMPSGTAGTTPTATSNTGLATPSTNSLELTIFG